MGTTGMVAQEYGKGNTSATVAILLKAGLIAIVSGFFLILFRSYIFDACEVVLDPTAETLLPLLQYFNIRIFAAPATILLYVITGWLLGMQDAKSALFLASVVNGCNAFLSYLLVVHYELSIEGVALGTLIGQYLGLISGLLILTVKYNIRFNNIKEDIRSGSSWRSFFSTNSNIFIRTFCLIIVLSFFKAAAAKMDVQLGAANILLLEFITIGAYGIDGFAFAAESICGKYFGRGNLLQFKKSVKFVFIWGISFGSLIMIVYLLFGRSILLILTNKEQIIELAMSYLPWLIISPILNSFAFIWDGIYVGTTATKQMRNTMILSTLLFFSVVFILIESLGNHGIWFAFTLFMISRGIFLSISYKKAILQRIS
jgi:MATE family multidrug resistance protein